MYSWRLKEELERLLLEDSRYCSLKALEFKFHKTPSNANYTAWQGGKEKEREEMERLYMHNTIVSRNGYFK